MKYLDSTLEQKLKKLITILFFLLVFLSFTKPVLDPDTPWHLKTGEYIVLNKTIPTSDPFSFADDPLPFIGTFILTQYWLSQICFFLLYKYGGVFGLALLSAIILTSLTALLRYLIRDKGFYLSFLIAGVFVYFMREFQGVRPQLFTFLFSGIVICLFEKYREKRNLTLLFPLIFLMPFWSNLHGGFIYGVVLIMLYTISEVIQFYIRSNKVIALPERIPKKRFYHFLVVIAFATLFSMANPNTYRAFLYAFTTHAKDLFASIHEYQSPFQMMKSGPSPLLLGFFLYCLASVIMIFVFIKRRDITPLLLLVFSIVPAMVSTRYIALLLIVATSVFRYIPIRAKPELPSRIRLSIHIALIIAATSLMLVYNPLKDKRIYRFQDSPFYAVSASNFLIDNRITGNIFASYNKSSFLMFRLFPESRLYSDSRFLSTERIRTSSLIENEDATQAELLRSVSRLIPKDIGTITFSSEENAAPSKVGGVDTLPSRDAGGGNMSEKNSLDAIKADIIVHEAVNMYSGNIYPFIFTLIQNDLWKLIYADGNVLIFVRDIKKYENIVMKYNKRKSLIYDEIIAESIMATRTPGYCTTTALALLLKGVADKNTYALIEKALAQDPKNWLAHYCNVLYELMDHAKKQGVH